MLLELTLILLGVDVTSFSRHSSYKVTMVVSSTMERLSSDNSAPSSARIGDAAVKKAELGTLSMHIKEGIYPNEKDPHNHSVHQHIISPGTLPSKHLSKYRSRTEESTTT